MTTIYSFDGDVVFDVCDSLRSGCRPISRPPGELADYVWLLESLIEMSSVALGAEIPDFMKLHEAICPHWCDVLEGERSGK